MAEKGSMMARGLVCAAAVVCFFGLASVPAALAGWMALPNAPVAILRHDDVFFVDPSRGWVVNGEGNIFRTTDGGETWNHQFAWPAYFRSVGFANAQRGWVGTLDADDLLFRTTNGGVTWTEVGNIPEPRPIGICGIWVVNESVVYACGKFSGPARLIKTTNGGQTWTSSDLSQFASRLVDCYFFDANRGFVVGGVGQSPNVHAVILATTNGGTSWQVRHTTQRAEEWCWKISFPTSSIGYVSIESFNGPSWYLKTTNGGQTWLEPFFADLEPVQAIGFATPSLGWIGGVAFPTYETTDGGVTWHGAGFGENLNRVRMLGTNLGYAVGETVYRYTGGTAGLTDLAADAIPVLTIAPNLPNPFSISTSIPYTLAGSSPLRATIHDVPGRTVRTLIDGVTLPGSDTLVRDRCDVNHDPFPPGSIGAAWKRARHRRS